MRYIFILLLTSSTLFATCTTTYYYHNNKKVPIKKCNIPYDVVKTSPMVKT
jgi:hypothetical protein